MAEPAIGPGDPFCGYGFKKSSLIFVRFVQAGHQRGDSAVTHQCDFLFLFLFHRVKPPFFYKDKAGNRELPVRLCWKQKKFIPGCFNLHELPGEYCEADPYQIPEGSVAGREGPEPFPPVSAVRTGQGRDMVFVKEGLSAEYRTERIPIFTAPCNRNMDGEGDL